MSLVSMTVGACVFGVFSDQGVTRCLVIEFDVQPVLRVVAGGTGVAKEFFVHVIFEMAIDASPWRVAMFLGRRVTSGAFGLTVFAHQLEVSELVIEAIFKQIHNIEASTFMLGMAGSTALPGDFLRFAMKAITVF